MDNIVTMDKTKTFYLMHETKKQSKGGINKGQSSLSKHKADGDEIVTIITLFL
jgi:Cys-tRNA synthase (O-phospho-L-seryl-tRNA:Cys-tRNA synthase)